MQLTTPIREAGLAFRMKSSRLEKLGILTLEDLLNHIPFRYEDYRNTTSISRLQIGQTSVISGTMLELANEYTRRKFIIQKGQIKDASGTVPCVWFNQSYITRVISAGDTVGLVGKMVFSGRTRVFQVKDYEVLGSSNGIHIRGLVPVYNATAGLSPKWLRNKIYELLATHKDVKDYLPESIRKELSYPTLGEALHNIHFPNNEDDVEKARERLSFDELFLLQLGALERKKEWDKKRISSPFAIDKKKIDSFITKLPFTLTDSQKVSVEDILQDVSKEIPMNRLLEGDVGSGKTVVAAIAMYASHLNGFQSVLMAPTEILAQQHYITIKNLFEPLGISVALHTGSSKLQPTARRAEHSSGQSPSGRRLGGAYNVQPNIFIGTHALIQKSVVFKKLGLVVVDEQQRFGVAQRAILREKGVNPHFLTMTATPIPRTALLVMYKDLDISLLKDMPKGRKKIKTWLVPPIKRKSAYSWIRDQIVQSGKTNQAFIVCPFIDESESAATVKAATKEFEHLSKVEFKGLRVGLLHGRLKAKDKNEILKDFKEGKYHVLVATPVVEVGIDIPNATIMVIEAADRFGLAQLHQLRGRVGRNDLESYCLLFSESENETVLTRLKSMEVTHTGFELAELDLKLRGPGEMYGTAQHGHSGLKIARFSQFDLVDKAKLEAEKILPKLEGLTLLKEKIEKQNSEDRINPD